MADGQNPFARIFSPSRGGVIGTIGRAAGFPSDEEVLMSKMGQGQQAGYSALQSAIQSGADPNRALLEWLQSDEGQQFFVSGGSVGDAINFINAQKGPAPETITLGPGERAFGGVPGGPMTMTASVPTTDTQNFSDMTAMAMMPPDLIAEYAEAQLRSQMTGDMTQQEAAAGRLMQQGFIDQEMHDKLLAGVLEFVPDPVYGLGRGYLVDKTTNAAVPIGAGMAQAQQPTGNVGEGVEGFNLGERPNYTGEGEGPPQASIIFGAGPVSGIQKTLGTVFGELDPALAAEEVNKSRVRLGQIRDTALQMRQGGRLLKDEVTAIANMATIVNETPVNAGNKLLAFMDWVDTAQEHAENTVARTDVTKENREAAEEMLRSIEMLRPMFPDRDQLVTATNEAREGPSQVGRAASAIPGVVKRAVQDLGGVPDKVREAAGGGGAAGRKPDPSGTKAVERVDNLPLVNSQEAWDALAPGDSFLHEDGTVRYKPGGKGKPQ